MEKYTKKERKEIYIKALASIDKEEFMCNAIERIISVSAYHYSISEFHFPEFFLFKPILWNGFVWFDYEGKYSPSIEIIEHRKTILEFCIEMCND